MNWEYTAIAGVWLGLGILIGIILWAIIRRHFEKYDPFIPEIPYVRPGTPVMIGDDLFILMEYQYNDLPDKVEHHAIFRHIEDKDV